jgi:hypothetical protein
MVPAYKATTMNLTRGALIRKAKTEKKTWTTYVLEAKVVTSNGFSISLATEWIENPANQTFDKQDCEIKAFDRIEYKGHTLYVAETLSEKQHKLTGEMEQTRFVHVTDIPLDENNVHQVSQAGRLRWKIENEGFNNQKNNGYNAEHKFSRTNFNATKNYYQLMQMADIINQLTYKIVQVQSFINNFGLTVNALIKDILSYLKAMEFDDFVLIEDILAKNVQLRY